MTRARSGRRERNVGRGAGARATRPGPATPATGASVGRLSPRWRDPADLTPAERLADLGALLATGFAYNVHTVKNDNLDHFTNFLKTAQAVRRDGAAAIDLCYIACGRFDGFWELGLKPWDVAAASLILDEAGGRSTLFDGSRLDLYADQIVASNGFLHGQMIDILAKK